MSLIIIPDAGFTENIDANEYLLNRTFQKICKFQKQANDGKNYYILRNLYLRMVKMLSTIYKNSTITNVQDLSDKNVLEDFMGNLKSQILKLESKFTPNEASRGG